MNNKADKKCEYIVDPLTYNQPGRFWCAAGTINIPEPHGSIIISIPWNYDTNYQTLLFISCITGKMYTRYKWQGNWSEAWVEK